MPVNSVVTLSASELADLIGERISSRRTFRIPWTPWISLSLAKAFPQRFKELLEGNVIPPVHAPFTNLQRADLRDACLIRANLRGADLRCAYLDQAMLSGANLSVAALHRASLARCHGVRLANFNQICAYEATFEDSSFEYCSFGWSNFRGAVLRGTMLTSCSLYNTDLRATYLSGMTAKDSDFSCADMRGASYSALGTFFRCNLTDNIVQAKDLPDLLRSIFEGKLQAFRLMSAEALSAGDLFDEKQARRVGER